MVGRSVRKAVDEACDLEVDASPLLDIGPSQTGSMGDCGDMD
jgi:hypothetical protein